VNNLITESYVMNRSGNLRVQLIGIAGTSRDILLSVFVLKSFLINDKSIAQLLTVETNHYKFILPSNLKEACLEIFADIKSFQPDVVGFSTYTWNYDAVMRISELVKKSDSRIKVILGGPEIAASDVIKGRFNNQPVDFIICGEGEVPLLRMLRCIVQEDIDGLHEISRLAFRVGGEFRYKEIDIPEADSIQNLWELPSPYLTALVPDSLLSPTNQANIETQRGCNFRCTYCQYHANFPSIRYRNPDDVVNEIRFIYQHGMKDFRITDANFLSKRDYAYKILSELIKCQINMSFFCEVIPSFVDEKVCDLMREYHDLSPANQILVGIGLQTINTESLRAIKRKLPIEHFTRAFDLLARAGVVIKTDIILGLPYESKETYLNLMEYIADKMRNGYNYLSLAVLRILPGSELEKIAVNTGLVVEMKDSEHFVYETATMHRKDMVEMLKISTVAFRMFHTLNIENRLNLRDKYFSVKDQFNISHEQLLRHFIDFFELFLAGTNSDYIKDDFPRAEHYWYFDLHKEIPDEPIISELNKLIENRVTL
jgi:radical SAM superfamily enzyme YgiQ (UPF0313 family)